MLGMECTGDSLYGPNPVNQTVTGNFAVGMSSISQPGTAYTAGSKDRVANVLLLADRHLHDRYC